jgi:hypothetical protein
MTSASFVISSPMSKNGNLSISLKFEDGECIATIKSDLFDLYGDEDTFGAYLSEMRSICMCAELDMINVQKGAGLRSRLLRAKIGGKLRTFFQVKRLAAWLCCTC